LSRNSQFLGILRRDPELEEMGGEILDKQGLASKAKVSGDEVVGETF